MEKQLKFVLLLPLEEIALRKLVVILWNQMDVITLFKTSYFLESYLQHKVTESLEEGERLVKNKLSQLKFPKSLMNKCSHVIKQVGMEIMNWKRFHVKCLDSELSFNERAYKNVDENIEIRKLTKLVWTSKGTINYQKTAEKLMGLEVFDIGERYNLACLYCLTDYITVLWEKLPEKQTILLLEYFRIKFENGDLWSPISMVHVAVAICFFRKSPETIPNFYELAFEKSALLGNKAATEYFYQKLPIEKRNDSLFKIGKDVVRTLSMEKRDV